MSVESLKRVLLKIKGHAREMRKDKHVKRLAAKPKADAKDPAEKKSGALEKVRELLSEA